MLSNILSWAPVALYYLHLQKSVQFIYDFFTVVMKKRKFNEVVELLTTFYLHIFFLAMPIMTWGKSRSLRTHLDHWRQFQVKLL